MLLGAPSRVSDPSIRFSYSSWYACTFSKSRMPTRPISRNAHVSVITEGIHILQAIQLSGW